MSDDLPVNLADASPRRLLVLWANQQDAWIRSLTAETILTRRELGEATLAEIYDLFLAEKGLSASPVPDVPLLELDAEQADAEDSLELTSISAIEGVNALAPGQLLEFDDSLTIMFGQNGSGKTGYSRILKRISAVRAADPILPDAHAVGGGPQPIPSAQIAFKVAGLPRSISWANEAGLAPFTRIGVFDADAVSLHVDAELGYVYTPAELALFSYVSSGLQRLQQRLAVDVAELRPGTNTLLALFTKGTAVYPMIESLGATTELAELAELADVAEDGEATQSRLQDEVAALRSNTLDAFLANAQQVRRDLKNAQEILALVETFDGVTYEAARETVEEAVRRRREAREQLFSAEELPGPPDEEWQRLVVAGDRYRAHLGLHDYPQAGDACLYCRQGLDEHALDLVRRYRSFLDETLVEQAAAAGRAVEAARLSLDDAAVHQVLDNLLALDTAGPLPVWAVGLSDLLKDAQAVSLRTAENQEVDSTDLARRTKVRSAYVATALKDAGDRVKRLVEDKANAGTLLNDKQRELAELTGRLDLRRHLPMAQEYVRRAKRAQRLEQLSKGISNGPAKQLTIQSKLASEDLVNKDFESLFVEECQRLRAPKVALTFQGRSGKAERKKVVARYKPSAVLAEGEQKVLALADFLAESRMRQIKAPLVFDDPVTSLDYRRLDEVAARIQQLSERHQVVVLTHNIMFASALIAARQNKKLRTKIYEVRDGGTTKGILAPDVEPRLDTVADLSKRIAGKLKAMEAAAPVLQDALVKETYDLIRAWCEAFVEQELLQNVTQRYRANIMMTRLDKIKSDRLTAAIAVVTPLFGRACDRMTGHSHAAEYMSTKPTVADLQEDWNRALAARLAYMSD